MELGSTRWKSGREAERGQVVPIVAVALLVLFGAAAMATDVGYLRYTQRIQQNAADSAAIAGANELAYTADPTAAARADAASNGFTHDGTNVTVTVNTPPSTGPYTGNASAVEVIVSARHAMFFERAFGITSQSVATRAVAVFGAGNGAGPCIYALKTDIDMNSATIRAPSCGIISNGIMNLNSDTITAASIGAVGQISVNASTFPEASPQRAIASIDPCPTIPACAYLTAHPPATSPCTYSNLSVNSAAVTLSPGVYCQSVNLNSATVTLQPGTYVFTNGLNANSTSFRGTGVTFYMVASSLNANSCTFNMTAPTAGNAAGMLIFQPASNTSSDNFNSSGGSDVEGAIYLPTGTLTTNSTFNTYVLIVTGDIHMNSSSVTVPANSSFAGSPRHGYLAE
ncbi:MAG TPA: pilus assembly protein TadG-related protein [Candidatus Elarobacter sp.]|jgi:hypothetical protein